MSKALFLLFLFAGYAVLFCFARDKRLFLFQTYIFFLPLNIDVNLFFYGEGVVATTLGFIVSISDIFLFILYFISALEIYSGNVLGVRKRSLKFFLPLLFFLLFSTFSIVKSVIPLISFYELYRYFVLLLGMFAVLIYVRDRRYFEGALKAAAFAVILQAFFAFMQYLLGHNVGLPFLGESSVFFNQQLYGRRDMIKRVSGLFLHSNMFATYLAFLLPVYFAISFSESGIRRLSFIVFISGTLALILSYSRGGLLSFFFGIMLFVAFYNKRIFKGKYIYFYLPSFIIFSLLFGCKIIDRFLFTPARQFNIRGDLNDIALAMIGDNFFTGIGLNNYYAASLPYDKCGIHNIFPAVVHSVYLLVLAETGIFAFVSMAVFIFCSAFSMIKTYLKSSDSLYKNFSLGLFCGLSAVLLHNTIDAPLRYYVIYQIVFGFIVLFIALKDNIIDYENGQKNN